MAALARKHDDEIKHHEKEIQRHLVSAYVWFYVFEKKSDMI